MDKKYRIMLVGCGVISIEWLDVLATRTDCEISALVDVFPQAAQTRKEQYNLNSEIYTDFDTALAEVKPDIVIILVNAPMHCELALKSLAAGCHVFSEKPMCMSREEGAMLLEAASKTDRVFNIMQNRRYLPGIRGLRHAVQSGALGKIWMVCCEIYVNADLSGRRNELAFPMLQDQAIHSFDSARFILGTDAKTVYCHSYNPEGSHYNGDGSGACIFEMEDGTVLVYNAVMDTNVMKTAWHSQWRIIGTKGTAIWNGFDDAPEAQFVGSDERVRLPMPESWDGIPWFAGAINEMLTALKEGRESENVCTYNYGSVAMTFSAIESATTGLRVDVK
ncbi:MAG: Gfo/Idh/MocA family oxidoreductase [Clostridiales bacterium]|nr:Gfo/Idh/MocA family oxidoreductase [Clostridiales bacterium]